MNKRSNPATRHNETRTSTKGSDLSAFAFSVSQGDYKQALQFLTSHGLDGQFPNEKAVCLMRLGRYAEAVDILRRSVLSSNCAWMREDVSMARKTNFAMALLLSGRPAGCKSVLNEINNETLPAVIKIRAVMNAWENSLTLWQRLNWRWLGVEPSHSTISSSGAVGDFEPAIVALQSSRSPDSPAPSFKTAA